MAVQEIVSRFPEIPDDLKEEPVFIAYANAFSDQLLRAQKPSNCSVDYDATNHYFMKLVNPIGIYKIGLMKKELLLAQLQSMTEEFEKDPQTFLASLIPENTPDQEVRGPGCV
ncbi:MAG: hypothetical protein VX794_05595 [Nitrospinota bacterium]|nr:hypothetical protein [Nitrospinota bacterium]